MDLSIFESFGWRDAVMAVVIFIAAYMVLTLLRLLQVRRHATLPESVVSKQEPLQDEPLLGDAVTLSPAFASLLPASSAKLSPLPAVVNIRQSLEKIEPVVSAQPSQTEIGAPTAGVGAGVEAELKYLRGDLARLSDQVAAMREDIEMFKASRNVSPLYSEAMGLAQQGHDARSIAGRCGISIGEAELVVALSRKEQGYDAGDESEDGDGRASADDPRR